MSISTNPLTPGRFSTKPRFLANPATDFRDWPINPNWRIFQGNRAADSSEGIEKNVWKREIRCVTQFMDFYLKDVSAKRDNVASEKLESLFS
ncbi:hypothetical protein GCM10009504_04930 [Pseudomonas laurentiana]|nr:hypothetical protein GCM10009504_04930 [Pseudomonas laurentiana]